MIWIYISIQSKQGIEPLNTLLLMTYLSSASRLAGVGAGVAGVVELIVIMVVLLIGIMVELETGGVGLVIVESAVLGVVGLESDVVEESSMSGVAGVVGSGAGVAAGVAAGVNEGVAGATCLGSKREDTHLVSCGPVLVSAGGSGGSAEGGGGGGMGMLALMALTHFCISNLDQSCINA